MTEQDRTETKDRYTRRWRQCGYDSRTLGWNKDCQWVRFQAAFENICEADCHSVLDVGCGFGDLLDYLRQTGWRGRYVGVDLVDDLLAEARRRHADDTSAEFVCDDIQLFRWTQTYDVAAAIGVFNHRLHQDNLTFIRETLACMWKLTTKVVICDFLSMSADPEHQQSNLYYADPRQLYAIAAAYSRRVMIHHAYMPFEFQIKMWHDDAFLAEAPVFQPYRHLASAQTDSRKGMGRHDTLTGEGPG